MKNALLRILVPMIAAAALPAGAAPSRLLVVTVTTEFRHASIPTSEKVIEQLAKESGQFTVDFVRQPDGQPKSPARPRPGKAGEQDPAYQAALAKYQSAMKTYEAEMARWLPSVAAALQPLAVANLRRYDGVMFVSTTGNLPLPDKQGFLDWIAGGKAFVGIHAATDTFHGFRPFIAMIGGEFLRHGPQVSVDCINQDPAHAATRMLPARWTMFDEIYQFQSFERAKVHGLLTLDRHPNDKTPGDYPVAWAKRYGSGRVFYTSLGHRDDVWDPAAPEGGKRENGAERSRQYQQHVLGGILWALGLAPGDATPQGTAK